MLKIFKNDGVSRIAAVATLWRALAISAGEVREPAAT
jgi:hypothetical protein